MSSRPPPRSRVDRAAEEAALRLLGEGKPQDAMSLLMQTYGQPLHAFALRIVRDRDRVKDICQQVFLEAFVGIARFEQRGSLWSWLCGIAYHRSLDDLRRNQRTDAIGDVAVWDALLGQPDTVMDNDEVATRRALEICLSKLSAKARSQVMMKFHFGLSYVEMGEILGEPHGTVQVRMSRILPKLRHCLQGRGLWP